jgi:hypothetical protein
MYFANNACARRLVDLWIIENELDEERLEQYNLRQVLPAWRKEHGGRLGFLPESYCKIFDAEPDPIVVQQNQASRRLKEATRLEDL